MEVVVREKEFEGLVRYLTKTRTTRSWQLFSAPPPYYSYSLEIWSWPVMCTVTCSEDFPSHSEQFIVEGM